MPMLPPIGLPYQPQSGVTQFPPPGRLLPVYPSRKWLPYTPRGLLDQYPDISPMLPGGPAGTGFGLMGQNVADILQFPQGGRGLLGMRQGSRGEGGGGRGEVVRPQQFEPFKNMQPDLWRKMSPPDRSQWLRDAQWQSWPVDVQRTFIEKFMPKGIGGP